MLQTKLIAAALIVASCAWAGTVYTSQSAFAAAVGTTTTLGFNGILGSGETFHDFNPLVVSGTSFSTPNSGTSVNVTKNDFYGAGFTYPADFIVNSANPGADNELDVVFAQPTFAFGLDYGAFAGGGLGTITLSDGTVFQNPSLPGLANTSFVGFVSGTPISSFSFVATQDAWVVQDLIFATPEPGTGVLLLGGVLAGLWLKRSRRIRA